MGEDMKKGLEKAERGSYYPSLPMATCLQLPPLPGSALSTWPMTLKSQLAFLTPLTPPLLREAIHGCPTVAQCQGLAHPSRLARRLLTAIKPQSRFLSLSIKPLGLKASTRLRPDLHEHPMKSFD